MACEKCKSSRVERCGCKEKCKNSVNATCVTYDGGNLTNIGIIRGDNLSEIIEKIEDTFCETSIKVITATEGVNLGSGAEVYRGKNLNGASEFRTIKRGTGIVLTQTLGEIRIDADINWLNNYLKEYINEEWFEQHFKDLLKQPWFEDYLQTILIEPWFKDIMMYWMDQEWFVNKLRVLFRQSWFSNVLIQSLGDEWFSSVVRQSMRKQWFVDLLNDVITTKFVYDKDTNTLKLV